MKFDEQTTNKIQELQIIEQNLQGLLMQKQSIQIEINESLAALSALKSSTGESYKIVGSLMIHSDKSDISADLEDKKKILELKLLSIEKQEKIFDEKAEKLKKEVTKAISEGRDKK